MMKNSVHFNEVSNQALKLSTAERVQLIECLSRSVQQDITGEHPAIRVLDKSTATLEETAEVPVARQDPREWLEELVVSG